MTEVTQLSQIHLNKTDPVQNAHLDVSTPCCVWDGSRLLSKEDAISIGRWKLGFVVFYSVVVLLLGGLAVATDRPSTFASVTTPTNPIASADTKKH